ncbi:hypothetical protein B0H10DRAFT_1961444 [Mycena sp. CBHHK59/15]|nr:hypothetical protein B0H10DRAFT_1961444 [Mycena sp. CBHHK59/15]
MTTQHRLAMALQTFNFQVQHFNLPHLHLLQTFLTSTVSMDMHPNHYVEGPRHYAALHSYNPTLQALQALWPLQLTTADYSLTPFSTTSPDRCLVYALRCQTLLRFDNTAYLEFLLSRMAPEQATHRGLFEIVVEWIPGWERKFSATVLEKVAKLCNEGGLVWKFSKANFCA